MRDGVCPSCLSLPLYLLFSSYSVVALLAQGGWGWHHTLPAGPRNLVAEPDTVVSTPPPT